MPNHLWRKESQLYQDLNYQGNFIRANLNKSILQHKELNYPLDPPTLRNRGRNCTIQKWNMNQCHCLEQLNDYDYFQCIQGIKRMEQPIVDRELKTWNTYQLINSSNIISNQPFISINKTDTFFDIFYNYTNRQFKFFSSEMDFLQKINVKPGEYFYLIFPCDNCLLMMQQQSKSLQILTCLDEYYKSSKELVYQPNFNELSDDVYQNINFSISLWIKEYNQEDGLNELQFYQMKEIQFTMNFRTQKFTYGEQKVFDFRQKIQLNQWYYFQFQSRQIKDQVHENQVFIKSRLSEQFKYQQEKIQFFYQNKVLLYSKNIIYTQFMIQLNSLQLEVDLCQPDCLICENQTCKICKNNLELQDNICKCPKSDQFTDQEGICKYQLNLLNSEEQTIVDNKCQFGYYLNYGECVLCPYLEGIFDINCLIYQNSQQKLELTIFQQNFRISLQQIQQIYQKVKCSLGCTSCVLKNKIIYCNQCSKGSYLQSNLCLNCQLQNCEMCGNTQTCVLCQDEYSLDENSQCVYTQENKFQQYNNYLQQQFQSDLRNCQFNLGQTCYICKQGYKLTNGVCQKYQSFIQIYNQQSNYGKINYGYVHSIKQDSIPSDLLDLYKIYLDTSLRNQVIISQYSDQLPVYYNTNLTTYSFCKKSRNCVNFITFNFRLIQTQENKFQLAYQNENDNQEAERLFDHLNNAFYIANLQESLKFVLINISSHDIIIPAQDFEKILYVSKYNYKGDYHLHLNGLQIQAKYDYLAITIDSFSQIQFNKCVIRAWPNLIIIIKSQLFELNDISLDGNVGFQLHSSNVTRQKMTVQNLKLNQLFVFAINANALVSVSNLKLIECQLVNSAIFIMNATQVRLLIQNTTMKDSQMYLSQIVYSEFIKQINYNLYIYNLTIVKIFAQNSQIVLLPAQFSITKIEKKYVLLTNISIGDGILTQNLGFVITTSDAKFIHLKNITLKNIQIDSMSLLISVQRVNYFNMEKTLFQNIVLNNCSSGFINVQAVYHVAINETNFLSFQGSSSLSALLKFESKIVLVYKFYFENTNNLQLYRIVNINSNASRVQEYEIHHLSRGQGYFKLEHDLNIIITQSIVKNVDFVGSQLIRLDFTQYHGVAQISTVKAINVKMQTQNKFDEKQSFLQILKVAVFNVSNVDLNIQINQTSSNVICYIFEQLGEFFSVIKHSQFDIKNYGISSLNQLFLLSGNGITLQGVNLYYDSQSTQNTTLIQLNAKSVTIKNVFFQINDQNCLVLKLLNKKKASQVNISNIHLKLDRINNFIEILESSFDLINISQIQVKGNIQERFILIDNKRPNSQILINGIQFTQLKVQAINFIAVKGDPSILFLKSLIFIKTQQSQYSNRCVIQFSGKSIYIQRALFSCLKQNILNINADYTKIFNTFIFRLQNKYDSININSRILILFSIIIIIAQGLRFKDSNQIGSSLLRLNITQFRLHGILLKNNIISNGQLVYIEQTNKNINNKNNNSIIDGLISYGNLCTQQCYLLQTKEQNITIKIRNSIYISDQANVLNQIFGINIIFMNGINIKTQLNNDYTFIDSDSVIWINNSYIAISYGRITKNNQNLTLDKTYYKFYYEKQLNDSIQIPERLQLQINQPDNQMRLLEQKTDSTIYFNIDDEYYRVEQYYIYFPSGQQLTNYKILDLKSKQFKEYINFINIYGIAQQNIKISLNNCYLNSIDNEIQFIPNYINSQILLSDIIIIANPYSVLQFQLEIQCIYKNITLQLNINAEMFKCQIGEILYQNQCQQCNTTNQYSVNKRSQVCKYIDHNYIEDYKIGLLKLKDGYWRPFYSNDQIELCKIKENCFGGWNVGHESCQNGYLGPLCNECDIQNIRGNGHYSKYKQQCFECEYNINVLYMIVIIIIQLMTLIITTRSQYLNNQRYQQLIYTNKYYKILNKLSIDQISVVFKQIQNYFFYIQFIDLTFDVDLNLGLLVNFAANPIQLLNPYYDCISQYYNYSIIIKLIFQIVTPLFIIILFYIMIIIINKFYKFKQLFVFIYVPLLYFFIIYQIIIFQNSISQITYVTMSGIKWVNGERSLQFYEYSNIGIFIFSSLILIIFSVIPLTLLFILKQKRTQLFNKTLLMKLGYLYQEYKNQIYYWEFNKLAFKITFITISYQLINQKEQSLLILSIYIFIISTFNRNLQPFNLKILNNFDIKLHTQFLVTLICIYMLVSQLFIKQIVIIFIYLSNLIQLIDILKFFIIKFFQTNPIFVDTILIKTLKINFKSQVQKKQVINQQFQKMKKYIKSKGSQRSVESVYTNRPYSIQISSIQSVQTEKNQEIELIRIK
ncbi:hypothetical protein pb186bvf_014820 [Paramecium bursaria]